MKPTWDVAGKVHFVFVDGDNSVYYSTYDWEVFTTVNAIKLYSNIINPRAAFYGDLSATQSGQTVFQGFVGGALTSI